MVYNIFEKAGATPVNLPGSEVYTSLEKGVIEVAPLAYMRGRTLSHAFVILDEAQHRKWVAKRDDLDWEFAKGVREYLQKQSKEHSVPLYKNWEDLAAAYGMIMGS